MNKFVLASFLSFIVNIFSFSLEEFAQILDIPCEGACVFTDRCRLDELAYGIPSDGPYQTNLPSIEDIISSIRINRDGQVRRIRHEEEIDVLEYQVLTREIEPTLKPLKEIIRENVFCLGVIGIMENPELENESYVLYDRVITPLVAQLERNPRRDRGTRRGHHSTSSSSAFDQPSSSHLNDDDDDGNDEETSRASTPFPIRYVNYLTNQVPQVFQNPPNIDPHLEPFYTRQTEIINRQVQLRDEQRGGVSDEDITITPSPTTTSSSLTPPNAPSKATSTNQTSSSQEKTSSSFHSKLQISPPSSHEPNSPPHFMRMEQYLTHTDYALWEVIVNGDAPTAISPASAGTKGHIPPKTNEQKLARKNELKAKITLLLAIPDEYLLKFHGIKDAKTLWEAIKARSEGLDKTYDRFQKLISQLEIHDEVISQKDANQKLLRSLPSAWNIHTLIMRNKSDLDTLSMDDLYNNLKVYEAEIKSQSSSSSNSQNVAFVSLENTSSTNETVNTAHEVSTASSQGQASSSTYADDVMFSFFANQSNSPQLDNKDLEHIDIDDLEEIDLK
ncbi:hypothetical protein Tco_0682743 [Tanacetum coccineum]|uniref:Uncharacterized protein n=1 Tax=Tanacetum coccineum TaxID=301880 RepID=A0ABQ4XTY8_9ASTR